MEGEFDAVLCMYHDQGLIPLKLHAFHNGVNVTLGLPFPRTSPDHGTAFEIAGKGIARPDSMIAAINLAVELALARHGEGIAAATVRARGLPSLREFCLKNRRKNCGGHRPPLQLISLYVLDFDYDYEHDHEQDREVPFGL